MTGSSKFSLMADTVIFISHASADDAFVAELRKALEALQLQVWVDSRNLRGGSKLEPEIEAAIEQARHVLVVLSPNTVNSPWVRREIKKALEVEQRRQADGYRVIPLLLPGIEPGALGTWFDEEPLGVKIEIGPGGQIGSPMGTRELGRARQRLQLDVRLQDRQTGNGSVVLGVEGA